MPSKRMLLFAAGIIVAVFVIKNQADKSPGGLLSKVTTLGA